MYFLILCGALCNRVPDYNWSPQEPNQNWHHPAAYPSINYGYNSPGHRQGFAKSQRESYPCTNSDIRQSQIDKDRENSDTLSQTENSQKHGQDDYRLSRSGKRQGSAYETKQTICGHYNRDLAPPEYGADSTYEASKFENGQNITTEPNQTGSEDVYEPYQMGSSMPKPDSTNTTTTTKPPSKGYNYERPSVPFTPSVPPAQFGQQGQGAFAQQGQGQFVQQGQGQFAQGQGQGQIMQFVPNIRPPPLPPSTRPPPPIGPGTRSEPVPALREAYAPSLQWHVGIYSKTFTPYMQICGGSLVKADVVLSAAHCFWHDVVGVMRTALFAVAAGKLLRPWEIPKDTYAQRSDVKVIRIPPRFRGNKASFQDDIAIVVTTMPFEYAPGVQPICVSFDLDLDQEQLKTGNLGTIAGWGLTEANGLPSQRLNFLELPYVDVEDCIREVEPSFIKYITSDKICAGDQKTGRALCKGDSGGGLVYYKGTTPYLRGIASTAERDKNKCNAYAIATFTHVLAHKTFLTNHVPDIANCEALSDNELNGTPERKSQGLALDNNRKADLREQSEKEDNFDNDGNGKQNTLQNQGQEEEEQLLEKKSRDLESEVTSRPSKVYIIMPVPNIQSEKEQEINVTGEEQTARITLRHGVQNVRQEISTKRTTYVDTMLSEHTKMVTMSVGSGERGVVTVPGDGADTFVCNCFCRN